MAHRFLPLLAFLTVACGGPEFSLAPPGIEPPPDALDGAGGAQGEPDGSSPVSAGGSAQAGRPGAGGAEVSGAGGLPGSGGAVAGGGGSVPILADAGSSTPPGSGGSLSTGGDQGAGGSSAGGDQGAGGAPPLVDLSALLARFPTCQQTPDPCHNGFALGNLVTCPSVSIALPSNWCFTSPISGPGVWCCAPAP